MLNSDVTYRVVLARIDDLRLQASERRTGNLVGARLGRRKSQRASGAGAPPSRNPARLIYDRR